MLPLLIKRNGAGVLKWKVLRLGNYWKNWNPTILGEHLCTFVWTKVCGHIYSHTVLSHVDLCSHTAVKCRNNPLNTRIHYAAFPLLSSSSPQPPAAIGLPSIRIILLFEEHCIKGIIQYITFWDIFFLLGTLLLGSIPDAVCIIFLPNEINRFILATE